MEDAAFIQRHLAMTRNARKHNPPRNARQAESPANSGVAADNNQFCVAFVKRKCGGCSFLHVPYKEQLDAKQKKVASILNAAFRGLSKELYPASLDLVQPVVPSPNPMGYRASAKFCLHEDRYGKKVIGLYKQGSRVVVDTSGCPANVALANEVLRDMFGKRALLPAKFYDHNGRVFQKSRIKFLTIRTSPSSGSSVKHAAVIISHTGIDKQAIAKWLQLIGLGDLCVYESRLTKADGDNFTGRYVDHVSGPETFPYLLNGQVFNISPASFFQANHSLAIELIKNATDFKNKGNFLLDLYGGFGAYSFAVKDAFAEINVVDGNKAAIATANKHAKEMAANHIKAFAETCENFLEKNLSAEAARKVTHVIVNPSRAGMSTRVIKALDPKRLVQLEELHYISCSPATFARDAKALIELGFVLKSVIPFDMFPQSDHVELVAKFSTAKS